MTSTQSKTARLKQGQILRAKALAGIDTTDPSATPPPGAAFADHKELAHNNTYGRLPCFYVDKVVVCRQCGGEDVWPAERQKWWYEVAKRHINTTAVLCRACREKEKQKKAAVRRGHLEGLNKKITGRET